MVYQGDHSGDGRKNGQDSFGETNSEDLLVDQQAQEDEREESRMTPCFHI